MHLYLHPIGHMLLKLLCKDLDRQDHPDGRFRQVVDMVCLCNVLRVFLDQKEV